MKILEPEQKRKKNIGVLLAQPKDSTWNNNPWSFRYPDAEDFRYT